MAEKTIPLVGAIQEVQSVVRPVTGSSQNPIYAVKGLTAISGGYKSDTVGFTLDDDIPVFVVVSVCAALASAGSSDGYELTFYVDDVQQTDYPFTGLGAGETVDTKIASAIFPLAAGAHEIYVQLDEGTSTIDEILGEFSGFVLVSAAGDNIVESS